jgi:CheY-like chemotaxis protein
MQASWCSCLVAERSLSCPACLQCFCKAPAAYKKNFWSGAPRALWDRKFEDRRAEDAPRTNPPPGETPRPLVLGVADEPDLLRVVESLGYGLIVARDGAEGLELARAHRPDLVLTDALMPKLDGREMGRRLKEDPATKAIKVVVMTSLYTSAKYRTEGFRVYKVDDYLSKPLDVTQVSDQLQKHLS